MSVIFGAHISISKGLVKAVDRANDLGCQVMQIFSQSPQSFRGISKKNIDAVDIDPSILLMYSVINYKKNNKKAALEYFDRARKVGFGIEKFKYFFRLNHETIDDSLKILTQMEKDL